MNATNTTTPGTVELLPVPFPKDLDPADHRIYAAAFKRGYDGLPILFSTRRTLPILERGWKRGWVCRPMQRELPAATDAWPTATDADDGTSDMPF